FALGLISISLHAALLMSRYDRRKHLVSVYSRGSWVRIVAGGPAQSRGYRWRSHLRILIKSLSVPVSVGAAASEYFPEHGRGGGCSVCPRRQCSRGSHPAPSRGHGRDW